MKMKMGSKRAIFVKQLDGTGEGRVYRVSPPLSGYHYVWVSAVTAPFSGPETFIFGCDSKGEVKAWCELEGSFKGALDIPRALKNAGYTVLGG